MRGMRACGYSTHAHREFLECCGALLALRTVRWADGSCAGCVVVMGEAKGGRRRGVTP